MRVKTMPSVKWLRAPANAPAKRAGLSSRVRLSAVGVTVRPKCWAASDSRALMRAVYTADSAAKPEALSTVSQMVRPKIARITAIAAGSAAAPGNPRTWSRSALASPSIMISRKAARTNGSRMRRNAHSVNPVRIVAVMIWAICSDLSWSDRLWFGRFASGIEALSGCWSSSAIANSAHPREGGDERIKCAEGLLRRRHRHLDFTAKVVELGSHQLQSAIHLVLGPGGLADVLADLHGAELGAAHGAEVGGLAGLLRPAVVM